MKKKYDKAEVHACLMCELEATCECENCFDIDASERGSRDESD